MATTERIPKTYDEAIDVLAGWHADLDPGNILIFAFPDPREEVVRLVEVSDLFPDVGWIAGFPFGKSAEFPFKSIVAQISHTQWDRVQSGQLLLPEGFELSTMKKVRP